MTPNDFNPQAGKPVTLAPALRRILAPNPSPMTYRGTNTYLLGHHDIAVIDPGPDSDPHLAAIMAACTSPQRITQILVTHSHVDHSPLAKRLSEKTGAPILAFGPSDAGRSDAMKACLEAGMQGGGEGIDTAFRPDVLISDGEQISAGDQMITAWHTPGHMGNHMCLAWNDAVFCGDLVMGWASSLVSPPDGDLTDFMASCEKLRRLDANILHSGHGAPIIDPKSRLEWLIEHRKSREAQIIQQLSLAPAAASTIATKIYSDTPTALLPAATRNVIAHLIDLEGKNMITRAGAPTESAIFKLL
ncbi:MBL fold metallo-hydrolase [Planktotalea sp.]|uniref:MBL fold metallo-hydrolase n=1 Tax=Planktotalea sp. TaxID=2029877 RepID=UPI0025ED74C0|nr:MBL fold metallo-hydrolase [Planktotalea sp.]